MTIHTSDRGQALAPTIGEKPVSGATASFLTLTLGSIGVVFGDIGTSPLYAFREAVVAATSTGVVSRVAVLGVLSLILWALIIVVTCKYVLILLRADNNGEGGTLSLTALASRAFGRRMAPIYILGVIGASMFLEDSVITPAISVLSAVEGLKLATPAFEHYVIGLAVAILVGLFAVQSRGTSKVAAFFGPIMIVWFVVIAIAGLVNISDDLHVLAGDQSLLWRQFLAGHGHIGLVTLGLVFLAVTGGEALYADLGHFGRKPIQAALAMPRPTGPAAQLFRTRRLGAGRFSGDRKPVLPHGAGDAAAADDRAGDRRDCHCQPSGDYRRLFSGRPGDPAWIVAPPGHSPHFGSPSRADLHSARNDGAPRWRSAAGWTVPHLERAGLGLRHCGYDHHGGRRHSRSDRGVEVVEMETVAGGRVGGAAGRRRRRILLRKPAQDSGRRMGAARVRRVHGFVDPHLAARHGDIDAEDPAHRSAAGDVGAQPGEKPAAYGAGHRRISDQRSRLRADGAAA